MAKFLSATVLTIIAFGLATMNPSRYAVGTESHPLAQLMFGAIIPILLLVIAVVLIFSLFQEGKAESDRLDN